MEVTMRNFRSKAMTAAAAVVLATAVAGGTGAEPAKKFVFGQSGGASMEASQEIFWKPFTAETGIEIEPLVPSSFGKLRAMVESGDVPASLYDLGSSQYEQAVALGLLEKINWDQINPGPMFPEMKREYGFGQTYFSTGMAWKAGTTPIDTWAEFWDVAQFPGKRCLADYPAYTLPLAVMASGVPADQVYPIDIDLAFKMLDQIAPDTIWWTTGSQPPQILMDGEATYCSAWNGRVMPIEGLEFEYNQGLLDIAFYVVPKGAPPDEVEAAMLLLHEWTDPEKQARYAERVFYTASSPDLFDYIDPALKDRMPTSPGNKDRQVLTDAKWWFEHAAEVEQRWAEWKLTR
jgi:putative spermidine/putrescine transport system substrate-binding protein